MNNVLRFSPLAAVLMLGACTTMPTGPSVLALPGTGRNFDQFRADDADCRQFASYQVGGTTANQAASDSGVKSAAVGTAVGALAGAALGGHSGAATGAGVGLVAGSVAGSGSAQDSGFIVQRRYDNAYVQCMYAKGDKVPVSGNFVSSPQYAPPAPAANYAPPPPPPPPAAAR